MKKVLITLFCLNFIFSLAIADSLGNLRTVNHYLSNGYNLESTILINDQKILYNLKNNGLSKMQFEPKLITCIYNIKKETTNCYKP